MNSQSIVNVKESFPIFNSRSVSSNSDREERYRISFLNNAPSISYPLNLLAKKIDTVKPIEELLLLEGDIRLCSLPIICYNPLSSQIYIGEHKNYSIQVEALFVINQLFLKTHLVILPIQFWSIKLQRRKVLSLERL